MQALPRAPSVVGRSLEDVMNGPVEAHPEDLNPPVLIAGDRDLIQAAPQTLPLTPRTSVVVPLVP